MDTTFLKEHGLNSMQHYLLMLFSIFMGSVFQVAAFISGPVLSHDSLTYINQWLCMLCYVIAAVLGIPKVYKLGKYIATTSNKERKRFISAVKKAYKKQYQKK